MVFIAAAVRACRVTQALTVVSTRQAMVAITFLVVGLIRHQCILVGVQAAGVTRDLTIEDVADRASEHI